MSSLVSMLANVIELLTYLCVCLCVLCLWHRMETTSCLEPWFFSRVTAHRSEVRVFWATIDTKPFFTFSLKRHTDFAFKLSEWLVASAPDSFLRT